MNPTVIPGFIFMNYHKLFSRALSGGAPPAINDLKVMASRAD